MNTENMNKQINALKRHVKLKIQNNIIEQKINDKLIEIQKNAHIKGFRPGKVPVKHLKNLYGNSIAKEILQQNMNELIFKTIEQNNEKTAAQPEIIFKNKKDPLEDVLEHKKDLEFEIKYEILPHIQVQKEQFKNFNIERISPKIEKKHILDAIKKTAQEHKNYVTKKTAAKKGDQLTIDFVGTINGEKFENGSANDALVEIGAKRYLEEFEQNLLGLKQDEQTKFDLTFPKDYQQKDLAGKKVQFEIKVKKVAKPQKTQIDDELAKAFGLESLKELETAIEKQIHKQAQLMIDNIRKKKLLDILDQEYQFQIPDVLLKNELDALKEQAKQNPDEDKAFQDNYENIAQRRVKLGILIAQIAQDIGIKVSDKEVIDEAVQQAQLYKMNKEQVIEILNKNPKAKQQFSAPIIERKTLDYIFEKTSGEQKQLSVDDIEKFYQETIDAEGAGGAGGQGDKPAQPVKKTKKISKKITDKTDKTTSPAGKDGKKKIQKSKPQSKKT